MVPDLRTAGGVGVMREGRVRGGEGVKGVKGWQDDCRWVGVNDNTLHGRVVVIDVQERERIVKKGKSLEVEIEVWLMSHAKR